MRFCKDCRFAIPASLTKEQKASKVPAHTGWLCTAPNYNVVTGERVANAPLPCADLRGNASCGPGAILFEKR